MERGSSCGQKSTANWEEVEEEIVIQNTVEPANGEGLEGVNEDRVEELLQSCGESLANNEIRELAEQRIQSEFTDSDAEEETQLRTFSAEFPSSSSSSIAAKQANRGPVHTQRP
jgi:hypothetical protein